MVWLGFPKLSLPTVALELELEAFQSSNDLHSAADALLAACEWAEANTAAELASEALQQFPTSLRLFQAHFFLRLPEKGV